MKKINLNPKPRVKKKFPIKLTYKEWEISIDKFFGKYNFMGTMLIANKNTVLAVTRTYELSANLKKCLIKFKEVLNFENELHKGV